MSLIAELMANDKKGLFKSDDNVVTYPTGFLALDYANGFWSTTTLPDGTKDVIPNLGLQAGSINSIIGSTGVGKTTLAIQIGWNIVKKFEDGLLLVIDCEKTSNKERVINITKADYNDERIRMSKGNVTIEDVLEMFNQICDMKEANKKEYQYMVENKSYDGKPFPCYVPTVFIIDSLPSFNSKSYDEETLGTNVDQMKAAKDITRFYTNILDRAWKYNCIFIMINHIKTNANINQFQTPPPGLMMLNNQTETLPRGTVAQYFSSTYLRIRTKKSNKTNEETEGFDGYHCDVSLAKSKTNTVGVSFPLAFNTREGYDPMYSIYEFAVENNMVEGKNPYLRIKGSDRRFDRRRFVNLMNYDEEFRKETLRLLKPFYEKLLGPKKVLYTNNIIDFGVKDDESGKTRYLGDITLEELESAV